MIDAGLSSNAAPKSAFAGSRIFSSGHCQLCQLAPRRGQNAERPSL